MNITEKRWLEIAEQPITSDGTILGRITVADVRDLRVGMEAVLKSDSQAPQRLQIKRIIGTTEVFLGRIDKPIQHRVDLTALTVADSATIYIPEQKRSTVPEQEIERLTYEEEPVIARRVIPVDQYGNKYSADNPLPISGSITIGEGATTPAIYNISAPIKGVEYSQAIPNNTTQFTVKARNCAKLQISYSPGATGTNFLTVTPGTMYFVNYVKLTGKTLYLQASKDETIIEMSVWT